MKFSLNLHLHTQDIDDGVLDMHVKGLSTRNWFSGLTGLTNQLKYCLTDESAGVQRRLLRLAPKSITKGTVTASISVSGLPDDEYDTQRGSRSFKQKEAFDSDGEEIQGLETAVTLTCQRLLKSVTNEDEWKHVWAEKPQQKGLDDYYDTAVKTLEEKDVSDAGLSGYVTETDEPLSEEESIEATAEADEAAALEAEPEDDREPEEADEDDLDYGEELDESEMEEETAATEETREEEKPLEDWSAEELRTYMLENAIEGNRLRKADMIEAIQESWDLLEDD